jgi:LytS/YehU family sensor histidine kinase
MLKKYIELEKLRYGNRLEVAFTTTGNSDGLMIAPLLLLPFVENSFKHGVSDQLDQCWINIHVHAENNLITFQISNSRMKKEENTLGGLGMENVQKRLSLLYPNTHSLTIVEEEETYIAKLELVLNKANSQEIFTKQTAGKIKHVEAI